MLKHISDTYEIIEKIGAGNSGEVYKAYHKNLKKYVVLKKIRAELKDVLNNRAEADVLKNLHHPCLPQVFDFLEADGDVYTVIRNIWMQAQNLKKNQCLSGQDRSAPP